MPIFRCPLCEATIEVEDGGTFAYNRSHVLLHLTSCPEIPQAEEREGLRDIADRIVTDAEEGEK